MEASNVGGLDKSLRIATSVILLLCYYFGIITPGWDIAALVAGTYLLITGLSGFCIINTIFKINTARTGIKDKI